MGDCTAGSNNFYLVNGEFHRASRDVNSFACCWGVGYRGNPAVKAEVCRFPTKDGEYVYQGDCPVSAACSTFKTSSTCPNQCLWAANACCKPSAYCFVGSQVRITSYRSQNLQDKNGSVEMAPGTGNSEKWTISPAPDTAESVGSVGPGMLHFYIKSHENQYLQDSGYSTIGGNVNLVPNTTGDGQRWWIATAGFGAKDSKYIFFGHTLQLLLQDHSGSVKMTGAFKTYEEGAYYWTLQAVEGLFYYGYVGNSAVCVSAWSRSANIQCCNSESTTTCESLCTSPAPKTQTQAEASYTTYADAAQQCASHGGYWRLCTRAELATDICKDTGCLFDNTLVWTSEQCEST